ncbi:murein transglycosylase domain-containing protein [Larsenimonas suaedae]|uniref:Murein transglycosylase domain-containing protein n=1 Tax=Larsenimonas suaedae TaxID=1851019 RepID=A0ABU1GWS4_9GAMM|nr:murein transglycosylase domain-containing protein [Larsenimonas suaedae]MCM2971288.1 murein transglycosylase domain-containing protein [Larsenimonas suaedae]MDR5895997.1 murein transglycosylase domain-containing protein [Larsenimonas suaedae]
MPYPIRSGSLDRRQALLGMTALALMPWTQVRADASEASGTWLRKFPALERQFNDAMATLDEWGGQAQGALSDYDALFEAIRSKAGAYWSDVKLSQPKRLVAYDEAYRSRAEIDFEQGEVIIETLDTHASTDELVELIKRTLSTPVEDSSLDHGQLSRKHRDGVQGLLKGQVVDQGGKSVRFAWRTDRYAKWLATHKVETERQENGKDVLKINIPLSYDHLNIRSKQFVPLVEKASRRHKVDPALIMAIISTESSFNPYAVSHIPAFGLMQIVPRTAGKDVFHRIYKRAGMPSKTFLFDPRKNIDTGTAYLALLDTVYLKGIRNPRSRRWCVIAAYNGGAGNVFRAFGGGRSRALARINALSAQDVYKHLRTRHPAEETRRYVLKVGKAHRRFKPLV